MPYTSSYPFGHLPNGAAWLLWLTTIRVSEIFQQGIVIKQAAVVPDQHDGDFAACDKPSDK